jgi:Spy/CpxP family protein refolding chaperone
VKSVRSLIVAGSLLLSAVAVVPAQQPTPTPPVPPVPGARPRKMVRPRRGKQFDKALLRGVTLSDTERTNLQAVRAKYAAQRQTLRMQLRTNAETARAARQRGDTAALRSIRGNVVSQRKALAQAERNDVRSALTPANQTKFDANLRRVEVRAARKPFRAKRLSNR